MPTRNWATTDTRASPCEASSATCAACSTVPAGNSGVPVIVSSPRRRMCWLGAGWRVISTWLSASTVSSCMTTVSAPAGSRLPVNRRSAWPGLSGSGTSPA
ncbi:hypothetical protein G6F46_015355 [Rhizopus delemar]|nr:hypothetical protein G6F46_015355 [Rhizopus delemar]